MHGSRQSQAQTQTSQWRANAEVMDMDMGSMRDLKACQPATHATHAASTTKVHPLTKGKLPPKSGTGLPLYTAVLMSHDAARRSPSRPVRRCALESVSAARRESEISWKVVTASGDYKISLSKFIPEV